MFRGKTVRLVSAVLALALVVSGIVFLGANQRAEAAAAICDANQVGIADQGGANDVSGQKDLTQFCRGVASATTETVNWNWDDLGSSGKNTLDACGLFDTDGDGVSNFAVCESATGNPAVHAATVVYTCNDSARDRCYSSVLKTSTTSLCSLSLADNPFGPVNDKDTRANCAIQLADLGYSGSGTAPVMMNVCTYPSGQPNSDAADCVINPAPSAPMLKLVKSVTNDNGGTRTANDWDLTATGVGGFTELTPDASTATARAVTAGVQYTLSETTVTGYAQSGPWVCVGGTFTSPDRITLAVGESATCTVTNDDVAPKLKLQKTVTNDNGGTKHPSDFTLTATGSTLGFSDAGDSTTFHTVKANVAYTLSESNTIGYTAGAWSCTGGGSLSGSLVTLSPGETTVVCTINNDDNKAVTSTTTKMVPNDTATLSGLIAGGGSSTVTFQLFGPGDSACNTPVYTEVIPVTGNGTYGTTNGFATPAGGTMKTPATAVSSTTAIYAQTPGTWRWQVSFSGDTNNAASGSACGAEVFTVQ